MFALSERTSAMEHHPGWMVVCETPRQQERSNDPEQAFL